MAGLPGEIIQILPVQIGDSQNIGLAADSNDICFWQCIFERFFITYLDILFGIAVLYRIKGNAVRFIICKISCKTKSIAAIQFQSASCNSAISGRTAKAQGSIV